MVSKGFKDFLTFKEMINDCVKVSKEQYYQKAELPGGVSMEKKGSGQGPSMVRGLKKHRTLHENFCSVDSRSAHNKKYYYFI